LILILLGLILTGLAVVHEINVWLFVCLFFLINIQIGILYPAATYLSMECGDCKQSTSAIMNIIKIGMPSLALMFSSMLTAASLLKLPITIIFFSFFALILLKIQNK